MSENKLNWITVNHSGKVYAFTLNHNYVNYIICDINNIAADDRCGSIILDAQTHKSKLIGH